MLKQAWKTNSRRKLLSATGDDRESFLLEMRPKQFCSVPYEYLRSSVEVAEHKTGTSRTLVLTAKNQRAGGTAVLYLYDSAYIAPPGEADWELAKQLVEQTGCDLYFPIYPLFPEAKFHEIVQAVDESMQFMMGRSRPEVSTVLGFAAGAQLCMSTFVLQKQKGSSRRIPEHWILNSPILQMPLDEESENAMRISDQKDLIFPMCYCQEDGIGGLIAAQETGEYRGLLNLFACDLGGMPDTHLYLGSEENAMVFRERFEEKCRTEQIPLTVHIGEGLMQCWGLYGVMKEAEHVRKEYFSLIQRNETIK